MGSSDKRITRYLKISFVAIAIACIGLFVFMSVYLNKETGDMTYQVSQLYMEEIHSQLQQKFDTILELRAMQLDAVIEAAEKSDGNFTDEVVSELKNSATVKDFTSAGLYRVDGTIEMIYGENIEMAGELIVNCNCENHNHMIQLGVNQSGEKMLVLGRLEKLSMSDGGTSDVLFATLPFAYFNEAMYLNVDETQVTSYVFDSAGNYIIKNKGAIRYDVVYDRIVNDFVGVDGKTTDDYVSELKAALAGETEYCTKYMVNNKSYILFVSKLNDGMDWYVMTDMPDNDIDNLLRGLNMSRYSVMIGVVIVIIAMMLCLFVGYYKLSHDQMVELQAAREAADIANKAKSHFLTSMSHDIRTPMNAIIGMSDIAMKNIDDPEKATQCLEKVQLSSKHLLGLINDILDMSSIESDKLTIENREVSLRQLISECVSIMQPQINAKEQKLDIFVGDMISEHIYGDNIRLEQIMLNLLSNANKYTKESGTIQLRIYQEPSNINGEHVRTILEVQDNGIGMSEEFIERIFDKFVREDRETVRNINGSGLGMAITKSIIDMMGGTIDVESKVGEGTLFRVTLESKKSRLSEQDVSLSAWEELLVDDGDVTDTEYLRGKKFLLAEDNDINAEIVEEIMSAYGATVHRAQNGKDSVEMFEQSPVGYYDAVFMDVHMPIMDGYEATRTIRALDRGDSTLPIVAMTADVFSDNIDSCKGCGMDACITKPLDVGECMRVLKKYL